MNEKVQTYLLIALGSAFGGVSRFWFANYIARRFGETFPWGTILVNISGSFLIGFIAAFGRPQSRFGMSPLALEFLMIGICGGYTTFSSFSLQTLSLARQGAWLQSGANIVLSVTLCLFAVWLGYLAGHFFSRSV
ncbi:MAG TPA: fluoride efflux transporter CrcB [Candidatus Saccharimonadales bacterium]|nr:fluoride efflux transporter CrcB [Candidatus Saccharimonadales bacterium]